MRAHNAVNAITIGQRQRRQTQPAGLVDQFIRMARAFEKRKVTLAPERYEEGHGQLRSRWRFGLESLVRFSAKTNLIDDRADYLKLPMTTPLRSAPLPYPIGYPKHNLGCRGNYSPSRRWRPPCPTRIARTAR